MFRHRVCKWNGKGGGLNFTLFHNTQSTRTALIGAKWSHSFGDFVQADADGATVVQGDGTEVRFTLLVNGAYAAPVGVRQTLTQEPSGAWLLTRRGDRAQLRFRASDGKLESVSSSNNNATTCTYSALGELVTITDASGRALTLGYSNGRLTHIEDYEGRIWNLSYVNGRLTAISEPALAGIVYNTSFAYDGGNNVAGIQNRLGSQWVFAYDSANGLVAMSDPYGKGWTFRSARAHIAPGTLTPSPVGNEPNPLPGAGAGGGGSGSDNPQRVWPSDVYGAGGVTDPTGATVEYGIDNQGRTVAVKGATDDRAVFSYDNANNRISAEMDSGATQQWTYNAQGDALTHRDPLNNVTVTNYNAAGLPVSVTDPLGHVNLYGYDARGNRTTHTDPLGNVSVTAYDADGQAISATDARGAVSQFTYDVRGNLTQSVDPLGAITTLQYMGDTDRIAEQTDALNRVTAYQYDEWGRQTGYTHPTTGNPGVSFVYDAEGRTVQTTDATGVRSYQYDVWGRKTHLDDPMGMTDAVYDVAGRLLTQTDAAGRTHSYDFDALKRLTSVSDGNQTATYDYTINNQMSAAHYPNGTRAEYSYDVAGQIVNVAHKRADNSLIVSYSAVYDVAGRMTQVTEQPSGAVTSYLFDDASRLIREERTGDRSYFSEYTYDAMGLCLTALRSVNGVVSHNGQYQYNSAGRVTQVQDAATGATTLYSYSATGNLQSITEGQEQTLYSYNERNELVAESHQSATGPVAITFEHAYGADGKRRWTKDYAANTWTWLPCGVSCCAGALVEKQKPIAGGTWTDSATYLRGPSGLVSNNGVYYHADLSGKTGVVTSARATAEVEKCLLAKDIYATAVVETNTTAVITAAYLSDAYRQLRYNLFGPVMAGKNPRDCAIGGPLGTLPGYNFCGPQGKASPPGSGVNELDNCCESHDACFAHQGCTAFTQSRLACKICNRTLCACAALADCKGVLSCDIAKNGVVIPYACVV